MWHLVHNEICAGCVSHVSSLVRDHKHLRSSSGASLVRSDLFFIDLFSWNCLNLWLMDRLKRISSSRIAKELELFSHHPPPGIFCYPNNDLLNDLEAIIAGTEGTPYENANFKLSIQLPDNYPFSPPIVRFVTPIYHPNIDSSGRICLSILKEGVANGWSVALGLQTTLLSIQQLFACPGTEDPLVIEICDEYRNDYALFARKARAHALEHAIVAEKANTNTIATLNTNSILDVEPVLEKEEKQEDVMDSNNVLHDGIDISKGILDVPEERGESMAVEIQEELHGKENIEKSNKSGPIRNSILAKLSSNISNNNNNNSNSIKTSVLPLPSRTQPEIDNDRPKKKFKLGTRKNDSS